MSFLSGAMITTYSMKSILCALLFFYEKFPIYTFMLTGKAAHYWFIQI